MYRKYRIWFMFLALSLGCVCGETPTINYSGQAMMTCLPSSSTLSIDSLAGPKIGTTVKWLGDTNLVYVPAGSFIMGVENGEDNPKHPVSLSEYWIMDKEVTNAQYAGCISSGLCTPPSDPTSLLNLSDPALREQPITGINFDQAQAFCKSVNADLPTEAQWEKAARGPDANIYPWGNQDPSCGLTNGINCNTAPSLVGQYPDGISHYKAYDLAGNVLEWTRDWYAKDFYQTSPASNPAGPENGTERVIRGGSYQSDIRGLTSAQRDLADPASARADLGFRCVLEYAQKAAGAASAPGLETSSSSGGACPGFPAPYCGSSPIAEDVPALEPVPACEPPSLTWTYFCSDSGQPNLNLVTGGQLTQTDNTINCQPYAEGFTCSVPYDYSGDVTVCNSCEANAATQASPLEITKVCEAGFTWVEGQGCIWNNEIKPSQPPAENFTCPLGQYYDEQAEVCIPIGNPLEPVCGGGFEYDSANSCCKAVGDSQYPGCPEGQINDLVLGCIPSKADSAPQVTASPEPACLTQTVSFPPSNVTFCTPKNGNDPDPAACQEPAPGYCSNTYPSYSWDSSKCACCNIRGTCRP